MYTRLINGMLVAISFGLWVSAFILVNVSTRAGLISWAISFLLGMCVGPQKKKR